MNLISRDSVLVILGEFERQTKTCLPIAQIEALPIIAQSEDQFWDYVDSQPTSSFGAGVEGSSPAPTEPVA